MSINRKVFWILIILFSRFSYSNDLYLDIFSEVLNTTSYDVYDNLEKIKYKDECSYHYIKGMFYYRGIVFEQKLDKALLNLEVAGDCGNKYAIRQLVAHFSEEKFFSEDSLTHWYKKGDEYYDPITSANYAYFLYYNDENYDHGEVIRLLEKRLEYNNAAPAFPLYIMSQVYLKKSNECKAMKYLIKSIENGGVGYIDEYISLKKKNTCK